MLAQVLVLTGELSVQVQDAHSTRTVTLVAGGSTEYARAFLADRTAAGTSSSVPYDLLDAFEDLLNTAPAATYWTVRLDPTGAVRITYAHGSGTGKVNWSAGTGGTTIRNLLGHTGADTGSLNPAGSILGAYAPAGTIVASAADDSDGGWQPRPVSVASATTAGGTTYAIDAGSRTDRRSIRLRLLPYTSTEQTSGEYLTPAFPPDVAASSSRWKSPSTTYYTGAYANSAHELVAACHRATGELGLCIGELQTLIAGTTTDFDTGSLMSSSVRVEEDLFPLSVPGWYARRDLALSITRTGRVTR